MATIDQVAARAGVSKTTVSRVLNGSPAVTAATRRVVQTAMTALDYRPSSRARELALGVNPLIVILAGDDGPLASVLARHLADAAFHPVTVSGMDVGSRATTALLGDAGAVVAIGPEAVRVASEGEVPVIAISPIGRHRVVISHDRALVKVAEHLRRAGRRHVQLWDGRSWSNGEVVAARAPFGALGLRLVRPSQQENLAVLVGGRHPPGAVVAVSPTRGMQALSQARALGIRVPHDLEIVTVGESGATRAVAMSAIVPPLEEASECVESMIRRVISVGELPPMELTLSSVFRPGVTTTRPQRATAI
jgi:LacI family transcriptional regulator